MKENIKVEKKIHPLFLDYLKRIEEELGLGRYQYIFSSKKGKISMIALPNYNFDGKTVYEIYCLEGNLFEDVEQYDSRKKAVERIKELLK